MLLIISIILLVLLFLILLLFLKVQVAIQMTLSFNDINLKIKLKVMKITILKLDLPNPEKKGKKAMKKLAKLDSEDENKQEADNKSEDNHKKKGSSKTSFSQWIDIADQAIDELEEGFSEYPELLKMIRLTQLRWLTQIGLDQADLSAISTGVVWMIKSQILALLSNYLILPSKMEIQVNPDFNRFSFYSEFSCMISFRLGKAILTLLRMRKDWKGRKSEWQNIQSKG